MIQIISKPQFLDSERLIPRNGSISWARPAMWGYLCVPKTVSDILMNNKWITTQLAASSTKNRKHWTKTQDLI